MTKLTKPALFALLMGGTLLSYIASPSALPQIQDMPDTHNHVLYANQDTYKGPGRTAGPRVSRA